MPLAPSTRLGPYEILSAIGAGGMGEVYLARDTKLGRDVAIKVLPDAFAHDAERMARFEREAQVLASLNHPNIAALYGLEESCDVRALVMELVEGPTLAERIAQGPVPLDEAVVLAKQIAEGLEYAHEKGIIHRDLKPANIKLRADGTVKLLDFGLAKAVQEPVVAGNPSVSPTLTIRGTSAGVILGTAAYMAPEQARGTAVDKRADIWAFGVVLYEMLTATQPFAGSTVSDTLAAVLKTEPDWATVPASVRQLVRRCVEKDAKRRLRDIGEARIAVQEYLSNSSEAQGSLQQISGQHILRERLGWLAACGLLLAALGYLYYRHPSEEQHIAKLSLLPPEKAAFWGAPAVSPDGRRVVFAAATAGKSQLWMRNLDSLVALPLPGTEGANDPFWSPDNRFIAFFADGKLKRIEAAGGSAQALCDVALDRGGTWNQSGVIVLAPNIRDGLYRVPAAGGAPTPLTTLDQSLGEIAHRFPWFLPDGHHFLYTASNSNPEKSTIYVGDLASKEKRRILSATSNVAYSPPGFLLYIRERALMAQPFDAGRSQTTGEPLAIAERVDFEGIFVHGLFSVSQNGVLAYFSGAQVRDSQLTWFNRSGRTLATVGEPGNFSRLAISPDGSMFAVDRQSQTGTFDIWLHDLARSTASRFTFGPRSNRFPVWSPDGSRIVFSSNRDGGRLNLYHKSKSDAGEEHLLLKSTFDDIPDDWSRDGRFIIFHRFDAKTKYDLWVLPLSSDRPLVVGQPFPFLQSEFNEWAAALSPDGKWMAYTSDETGRWQVYLQTFPVPGGKSQVSTGGGMRPKWSRDGKELFYIAGDGKLTTVALNAGLRFEAGAPKPLFDSRLDIENWFDFSPDSQRFLLPNRIEGAGSQPMTVVVSWPAGLKR